jgi:hypothetical protein
MKEEIVHIGMPEGFYHPEEFSLVMNQRWKGYYIGEVLRNDGSTIQQWLFDGVVIRYRIGGVDGISVSLVGEDNKRKSVEDKIELEEEKRKVTWRREK